MTALAKVQQGGPPKRAPDARRSTATSKREIMPESLEYDLEQILRDPNSVTRSEPRNGGIAA